MYTELKELAHFVATFVRTKLPKRRMSLFIEHLANGLLARYCATWNVDNPAQGAGERALRINTASGTSQVFTTVATSLFVDLQAVLSAFPMDMVIYWNAGEVFYHLGDTPTNLPIWSGDINADRIYSPVPARISASETVPANNTGRSGHQGGKASAKADGISEMEWVCLEVVPWDQHSDFYWNKDIFLPTSVPRVVFRYLASPNSAFTTTSFAVTRFGSRRSQPDHEALKRIQHAAERMSLSSNSMPATNRQVVSNGQLVYPSSTGMVVGQAPRGVVLPVSTRVCVANGNGRAGYGMTAHQHQTTGRTGAVEGATGQPNSQYYAMGDVAFLNYFTSCKPSTRVALRPLHLGGGDGHGRIEATHHLHSIPLAHAPHPNLLHNAGDGVVYAMSGTAVPAEGSHINAANPGHPQIVRVIVQGAGDGYSTESGNRSETARAPHRGGRLPTQSTFYAAGTAPVGGDLQLRALNIARQVCAPGNLNGVEEGSAPSNGTHSEGGMGGAANKWTDMA